MDQSPFCNCPFIDPHAKIVIIVIEVLYSLNVTGNTFDQIEVVEYLELNNVGVTMYTRPVQ